MEDDEPAAFWPPAEPQAARINAAAAARAPTRSSLAMLGSFTDAGPRR
jgi:hypothetical protein